MELGRCLARLNVTMGDSRDQEHRQTFHPFVPGHHLIPGDIPPDNWYWHFTVIFFRNKGIIDNWDTNNL